MSYTQGTSKTYIKSNAGRIKTVLAFLSAIFFLAVVALCIFVVLNHKKDDENLEFDQAEKFHFSLENNQVTIDKFIDDKATSCVIPASVQYGEQTYPVTKIGVSAFANHSALTEVVIPASITKISGDEEQETGAFSGCVSLEKVDLGTGLVSIGAYAFQNCVALKNLHIPANIQEIQKGAFQCCLGLETLQLDSNVNLPDDTFFNCLNVVTLKLGNDVILDDDKRLALSELTGLIDFIISDDNPLYELDNTNSCLFATENTKNDTLILAGCETVEVPVSVTKIVDWAWGVRAQDGLYIADTVTDISADAIHNQSICTNAISKPAGWLVTVPVYTNAQPCIFNYDGQSVVAYVYKNNDETIYPEFEDLFPNVKPATSFLEWDPISVSNYNAVFASANKSQTYHDLLGTEISRAGGYIKNINYSLRFKLDFWEEYKNYYYSAEKLEKLNYDTYDYILNNYVTKLNNMSNIVFNVVSSSNTGYEEYLENQDWTVGLKNLVNHVKKVEAKDFISAGNNSELISRFYNLINDAELVLNHQSDKDPQVIWYDLRNAAENLLVDISQYGPLGLLVSECENLQRVNYTKESWQNLQQCIDDAKGVLKNEHCLLISSVRHKLENAYDALEEVNLEKNLAELGTWILICDDLKKSKARYESREYDNLMNNLITIKSNIDDIMTTRNKISIATNQLKSGYHQLVIKAEKKQEFTIFNINTIPYFIIAAVLFTGAVITGALSGKLKQQLRRSRE